MSTEPTMFEYACLKFGDELCIQGGPIERPPSSKWYFNVVLNHQYLAVDKEYHQILIPYFADCYDVEGTKEVVKQVHKKFEKEYKPKS